MKHRRLFSFFLIMIFSLVAFTGCESISNSINKAQVKLGFKNQDFEYIKQGKISKIVIQSTRDNGFRFVVTDNNVINEIYDMLSTAKPVPKKTTLRPDYTFQLYKNDKKVYAVFNYVAGVDKKYGGGNFYSGNKSYIVSNRIDSDIIKNFWEIDGTRTLVNFNQVYYKMALNAISKYITYSKDSNIGIEIDNDVEAEKFISSTDLEDFKKELPSGVSVIESTEDDSNKDVTLNLNTEGYDQKIYKCIATFNNKKTLEQKKYYMIGKYNNGYWNISVQETKPKDF